MVEYKENTGQTLGDKITVSKLRAQHNRIIIY